MKYYLFFLIIGLISCTDTKKLTKDALYFQDVNDSLLQNSHTSFRPTIQKGDILYIGVNTSNEASSKVFNQQNFYGGMMLGAAPQSTTGIGYLVDETGNINFPYVGLIKVEGLGSSELREKIAGSIKSYVDDAVVSVRIMNYKITVLGEVVKPGSMSVPNERITILDALGLAGDLTPFARRDNIKVIREVNGKREIGEINLKKGDIFNSPYFYLRQNDVVYVELNNRKMLNVDQGNTRNVTIALAGVSALALIITTISNLK
jgi:polysaccharide biosynthesis/export protein